MSRTVESRSVGKLDTMNAVETCPICGGSGWKITEREGISGAEKCQCADAGREQRIEERAGIPLLYENASVDNFILPSGNPQARSALASVVLTVRGYVREYPAWPEARTFVSGRAGHGQNPPGRGGAARIDRARVRRDLLRFSIAAHADSQGLRSRRPVRAIERRINRLSTPRSCCWTMWGRAALTIGWKIP